MTELAPVVVDAYAIARDLGLHPVTIRKWAAAGHITRRGRDTRGRTLYDLDEVQAFAARHDTPSVGGSAASG